MGHLILGQNSEDEFQCLQVGYGERGRTTRGSSKESGIGFMTVVTIRVWTNWKDCNDQVLNATPLFAVFPDLDRDLWSRRALNSLASALGNPIGAVQLGKANNRPSAMIGVVVRKNFTFPKTLTINTNDKDGRRSKRVVKVTYPCKPLLCQSCQGFGHSNCGQQT